MSQQTTLIGWNVGVQPGPGGQRILVMEEVSPPTANMVLLPLPPEVAKEIGDKLAAPSVALPSPGETKVLTGS